MAPVEAALTVGSTAFVLVAAAVEVGNRYNKAVTGRHQQYAAIVTLLLAACVVTVVNARLQHGGAGLVMFTAMAAASTLAATVGVAMTKLRVFWVVFAVLLGIIAITIPLTLLVVALQHMPPSNV